MALKYDLWSPSIQPFTIGVALPALQTLRGIDIFADGDLTITDTEGNQITRTFANVAPFVRWVIQIASVDAWTGAGGADDLVGLR